MFGLVHKQELAGGRTVETVHDNPSLRLLYARGVTTVVIVFQPVFST
jgi:hypothetical protein